MTPEVTLTPEQRDRLTARLMEYAASDTVLFFSSRPAVLFERQSQFWLPLISWVNDRGCDFKPTQGLDVPPLSEKTQATLREWLDSFGAAELVCVSKLAGIYRSVILALAVGAGRLTAEEGFELSVLEESFQNESWPMDEDAVNRRVRQCCEASALAAELFKNAGGA